MPKVIDLIKKLEEENKKFFSLEYFPPKTEEGKQNLYERLDRMTLLKPVFVDVTWGAGGSTSEATLEICRTSQNLCMLETQMHLTCTNLPIETTKKALEQAKADGIRNILALRGDPPRGEEWKQIEGGFAHAVDLVRYIRKEFGNFFGICVAGYPEGHIDAESFDKDLQYLKEKVDAGADLIITQLFYDTDLFIEWVRKCRKIGITVPILPGIMPIQSYVGFMRMTQLCRTKVPQEIYDALEPIQNDDAKVKEYGVSLAVKMCSKILAADVGISGLHFYTLNLEKSVTDILEQLQLITSPRGTPVLPFKNHRPSEDVRPVFWVNRPKSYLSRTAQWDEFPNGRWGDTRSAAYGDLTDYHLSALHFKKSEAKQLWGESLSSLSDVAKVFVSFLKGEIQRLPWVDSGLRPETAPIREDIININRYGIFSINSQPAVNGAKSDDESVGWGGPGGFVYQKAYIEIFVNPEVTRKLLTVLKGHPNVTFHAIKHSGEEETNCKGANALTWGVFPGKEIIQPTIVDSTSFKVWKDEAFGLWKAWSHIYEEGSNSRKVIESIHDNYYLINLVDNNFVKSELYTVLHTVIEGMSPLV